MCLLWRECTLQKFLSGLSLSQGSPGSEVQYSALPRASGAVFFSGECL